MPLEAAAKMRASLHAARAAPGALRPGDHQQPRRRPDRAAAGRPPRRGDARRSAPTIDYRNGYYFATAPGRLRGDRDPLPVRVGHGHRERDARGDPRRRPHGHPAGRPGARGRRPDRVPPEDGRRGRADLSRTRSRSRAASALRGAEHRVDPRPDRGRHVRRRRRRDRRPDHARPALRATTSARSSTSSSGPASASPAATTRSRSTAARSATAASGRRHRDRAVPGPRHRPPAADVGAAHPGRRAPRTSTRRSSRTASSGWPSCAGWAPGSTSSTASTPSIHGPHAAARRRRRDRRPARRRLADPRRARRRRHDDDPRCAPRSPGL